MSQPSIAAIYQNARNYNLQTIASDDQTTAMADILTPEELAQRLKVGVGWIYEKRRPRCKNPLPAIPMGKTIRFDWDAIVEWLKAQAKADEQSIARRRRQPIKARKKRSS